MVYHRSETGSSDKRRPHRYSREEDSSSQESNDDDKDDSKSRDDKYSDSRSRSSRDDKYSDRSSRNSRGRDESDGPRFGEGSRFGGFQGEGPRQWNNDGFRPWDNGPGFRNNNGFGGPPHPHGGPPHPHGGPPHQHGGPPHPHLHPHPNNFGPGPGPRFNMSVDAGVFRYRDAGQFNQQVAQYSPAAESFNYRAAAEAQKVEEDKKKNVFQNDGSFLEMFKKMQESKPAVKTEPVSTPSVAPSASVSATVVEESPAAVLAKKLPMVGKRRGGRVLKTGMVKKLKIEKPEDTAPKNAWSMYMNEVRKYKEASCEEEGKTRPLVK